MTQMVNAPIDHNLILFNCHTFVQNAKLTTKIHSLIIIIIIIIIVQKAMSLLDTKMVKRPAQSKTYDETSIVSQLRHSAFLANNFYAG